jgi:hypothetical protein
VSIQNKLAGWVINKLGGITLSEQEERRLIYEKWAVKHLTGKNGRVTPDCYIYIPYGNEEVTIIRSKIDISRGAVKNIIVAPWCNNVVLSGLQINQPYGAIGE